MKNEVVSSVLTTKRTHIHTDTSGCKINYDISSNFSNAKGVLKRTTKPSRIRAKLQNAITLGNEWQARDILFYSYCQQQIQKNILNIDVSGSDIQIRKSSKKVTFAIDSEYDASNMAIERLDVSSTLINGISTPCQLPIQLLQSE